MSEPTLDRIKKIVVDLLNIDEASVTTSSSFQNDLGADSLDTVELIMKLEEEFEINIPEEDAEKIVTIGDAIRYIEKQTDTAKG